MHPVATGPTRLLTAINVDSYRRDAGSRPSFLENLREFDHRAALCWSLPKSIIETPEQDYATAYAVS